MAQTNEHDKNAARREQIITEQKELTAKFKRDGAQAKAKIERLEAPLHVAKRERFELERDYHNTCRVLQTEREALERELLKAPHREIDAVLSEVDELERAIRGSGFRQTGDDAPIAVIWRLRREIESLKLESAVNVPQRLAELRAQLPSKAEATRDWPPFAPPQEEESSRTVMGAIFGGRHRKQQTEGSDEQEQRPAE